MAGADDDARPVPLPAGSGPGRQVSWPIEKVAEIYRASIDHALASPTVARVVDARPGVTGDDIRARMFRYENVQAAIRPCRVRHLYYLRAVTAREWTLARRNEHARLARWSARAALALVLLLVPTPVVLVVRAPALAAWLTPLVALLLAVLLLTDVRARARLRRWALLAYYALATEIWELAAEPLGRRWGNAQALGTAPVVRRVVDELLGEDRDALLLPDSTEGLRSPGSDGYHVDNRPLAQLRRKIDQIDGGAIAVSGPRGAGKTTLLENAVGPDDFTVVTHAPATYAPHDFLLSLFVTVCEGYLRHEGQQVPDLTRLSRRALRGLRHPLTRGVRWFGYALPAAALVVVGLFATARSLREAHGGTVERWVDDLGRDLGDWGLDAWHGRSVGAALVITCAGLLVWALRRATWFTAALPTAVRVLARVAGTALVVGAVLSLPLDPEIRRQTTDLYDNSAATLLLTAPAVVAAVALSSDVVDTLTTWYRTRGPWLFVNPVNGPVLGVILGIALVGFLIDETGRAVLTDPSNPTRLLAFLAGLALWRLAARPWRRARPESDLLRRCRDQLYRLQTAQTTTAATNLGGAAAPLLTLGASGTATLATVPPNYPALVADFRRLLGDIAAELARRDRRTVVVIDEVDRLGSAEQALAFLREIKAVLGVPRVHFLLSVADDVGAAFVRRGLPHRDVTDSSLDDIVHVGPATLAESAALLTKRAPGISDPYVLLAHALSGGLPRDLIRYARRLLEIQDATEQLELPDIARAMILEEVHETLDGFHNLLARQRWTPETSAVLVAFRDLMGHLRTACTCCPERATALEAALTHFATRPAPAGEEARVLLDEAAVYAYFSLTLLEIFGRPGFAARRETAALGGADGDPETLADARRELAVSPYSARPLLDAVRRAWALAIPPAGAATPPPPRSVPCRG
ncbi:hypothetical protein FH609_019825 [Streptomyces sp. 3MP-14]|uniref:KAP NTPase domain-containing protein n=1 Tax=Streptomyces mimosae TaxID=2586635 RepID=A0A5N5ZSS4_9ACTN|nr:MULTISPECIES: P-loop NTPase fold protein [Streptomyces]KAB8158913.1 hypothetical protein FH607_028875 [Streptomyces mimosae]KAB8174847.1 hypothetical protein FH609_019825 [Streptomyces sp. 3MP-14]